MKKLFTILSIFMLFFGTVNAKSLSSQESAALFSQPADVQTLSLSDQELKETDGKFLWLLIMACVGFMFPIAAIIYKNPPKFP